MSESTKIDFKKLATMSRLAFTPEQEAGFNTKFASVIGMVNTISEVDTTGIPPLTTTSTAKSTPERADTAVATGTEGRDAYQKIAPKAEMGFYVVPKVVE
jgi:aspartyl-tRNA(Asn)/glutamyl-tRNA(Gln) amidotransferase subunit C